MRSGGVGTGGAEVGSRARGFTLIELLAVVAVIGLLMVFIVPALDGLTPRHRLRGAARKIAATIDLARGTAVGRGRNLAIYYDLDDQSYRLYGASADGGAGEPPWGLSPIGASRPLPRGVRFRGIQPQGLDYQNAGILRVRFDPVAIEGSHIVHLESTEEDRVYSVKYNAFLGQAMASRGEAEFEEP